MASGAGRKLAEAIAASGGTTASTLGLRFDRVVERVLDRLTVFADANAPEGVTALLTLTAPLRAPDILVVGLERAIAAMLRDAGESHRTVALNGNRAELRLVARALLQGPRLLGFVHNPDVDPALILELAERWLRSGDAPV